MVFLGIVFKTRLKYSKELLAIMEKLIEWLEDRAQVSDKLAMMVDHSMETLIWVGFSGRDACLMASTFFSIGEIPLAERTQPMYVTDFCMNLHLLSCLSRKPQLSRRLRTLSKFLTYPSSSLPGIRISSLYSHLDLNPEG